MEWYSARQLVGLPGVPGTRRAVSDKAKRESWTSRTRVGRGGGVEYHIGSLPEETRKLLLSNIESPKSMELDSESLTITIKTGKTSIVITVLGE